MCTSQKRRYSIRMGTIIGSQGTLLDVTERRQAEAQLASERDMLRALMDSSTDAIYFKDRESRFIRCSEGLAAYFHLPKAEDAIGKRDFDFFGEEHARPAFEDEQEIIRTGKPIIGKTEKEIWLDGHVTWALTSKMPLRDDHGEIIGTFGISKDITAIKEAEATVEELHKQLLQTSRQAGMAEVATSVLHNVGNVLNSVNVSATLLLDSTKKSNVAYLAKAVALLNEHSADLGAYVVATPKESNYPAIWPASPSNSPRNSSAPSLNWKPCGRTSNTSRKSWPCSRITPRFQGWSRRSR